MRRVLFCLGVPAVFVAWAATSRFVFHESQPILWWPFALLGIFSIVLGFRLLRASGAQEALGNLVTRVQTYQSERSSLQTKIDFLTAEREIGMILNDTLERRVVLDRVLETTASLFHADPQGELRFYLRDAESDEVRLAAARRDGRAQSERDLKQRRSIDAILEPAAMQARVIFASEGDRLKIWIPLVTDGAVAGVLELRLHDAPDLSGVTEHLEEYGRFLSLAVRAPELYRRAAYDPLTGLGSRRQFDQMLDGCIERARAGGGPFAVIMVDIDHFKKVNDTHGHEAGDAVLRGVAETIRRNLRRNEEGTCDGYRYGGEEMAVVVSGADAAGAARVAERVRRAIEKKPFRKVAVTVSCGVAGSAEGPADVLARADAALYRAKGGGRNRVETAA